MLDRASVRKTFLHNASKRTDFSGKSELKLRLPSYSNAMRSLKWSLAFL